MAKLNFLKISHSIFCIRYKSESPIIRKDKDPFIDMNHGNELRPFLCEGAINKIVFKFFIRILVN